MSLFLAMQFVSQACNEIALAILRIDVVRVAPSRDNWAKRKDRN